MLSPRRRKFFFLRGISSRKAIIPFRREKENFFSKRTFFHFSDEGMPRKFSKKMRHTGKYIHSKKNPGAVRLPGKNGIPEKI
jgi:hypothetical protein